MRDRTVKKLLVTVVYDGKVHELFTYRNEYRSLMMLIYDKLSTEEFGECLGIGKCGTCLVEMISSGHQLTSYERNEETTLLKAGHSNKDVRLSCQIMADEFIDGLTVKIYNKLHK
ncbi:MAG: 2Fe-2S iron-sulfur cluster-binding protein [Bacteroidota bacterium]|nr:2Fe-2S iron-sulfur cluster-binding protein [Bacteroidota bacterium]